MSQKLLNIRVALAALLIDVQALGRSRELSASITCLQAGRMLLGVVAQRLGAATPYPLADDPKSTVIHPSADVPVNYTADVDADPVLAVKDCRKHLQDAIDFLEKFRGEQWARAYAFGPGVVTEAVFDRALVELILAKNWLGEQLAVIAGHALVKPAPKPEDLTAKDAKAEERAPEGLTTEGTESTEGVPTEHTEDTEKAAFLSGVTVDAFTSKPVASTSAEPAEVLEQALLAGDGAKAVDAAKEVVDDAIRTHLAGGSTVTEICRVLDVTEYRVNKIKAAMRAEAKE